MRRIGCVLAVVILSAVSATAGVAGKLEARGAANVFLPSDSDFYATGYGFDLQAIYWLNSQLGVSTRVGYGSLPADVDSEEVEITPDLYQIASLLTVSGDLRVMPVGVSVLYRRLLKGEKLKLDLEAGVDYVVVDGELDAELLIMVTDLIWGFTVGGGASTGITVEDGIVGRIGLDLEYALTPRVSAFGGGGYLIDISKGDVVVEEEEDPTARPHEIPFENELGGWYARAGGLYRF